MPYMRDVCTESRSTESQKESIYVLPLTIYKRNSYKRFTEARKEGHKRVNGVPTDRNP